MGFLFFIIKLLMILDSSMVEHTAVNRGVVGSSPTRGVVMKIMYELMLIFGDIAKW